MGPRIDFRNASPAAWKALLDTETAVRQAGLEPALLELVRMRASQINGCAYCLDMHGKDALAAGEDAQRLLVLPAWREAPFYSARERAALAWTEAVTRIGEGIDDALFAEAHAEFGDAGLVDLTLAVVAINGWNRMCVAFRSEVGSYVPPARDS
jgi:AhpD family alkylhydroperoxidase